jgi:hypothetical protein
VTWITVAIGRLGHGDGHGRRRRHQGERVMTGPQHGTKNEFEAFIPAAPDALTLEQMDRVAGGYRNNENPGVQAAYAAMLKYVPA